MPYRKPSDLPTTGNDCPRCQRPLVSESIGASSVERCTDCLGVWVAASEFNELLLDLDRQEAVREREPGERSTAEAAEARNLLCPCCGQAMGSYNFGRYSGVIVDSCRKHGIWLDRGELRRIVDFLAERGSGAEGPVLRTKGATAEEFTLVAGGSLLDGILDLFLRTLRGRVR